MLDAAQLSVLLQLTLECLEENLFENRSIGLVVCLKNDRSGRGLKSDSIDITIDNMILLFRPRALILSMQTDTY